MLSESQDLELKQYINMDKTFYGVTITDIFLKIANAIKLLIDSIKKKRLANANFVRGFLERQKDSSLRKRKE